MFSRYICWIFLLVVTLGTECYGYKTIYKKRITKGTVHGEMMTFCEYKLLKMLPKSKILDPDACLSCKCNRQFLVCKDAKYIPGCKSMPGGEWTQNPLDKKWEKLINPLIKQKHIGNFEVLEVRSQVVAGYNYFMQLRVGNMLCDFDIYVNLSNRKEIMKDTCDLKK